MLYVETKEVKNEIVNFECILKTVPIYLKYIAATSSCTTIYLSLPFSKSKVDLYNYIYGVFINNSTQLGLNNF